MKISYNWLRTYVDLDETPGSVAELLTMVGLEVEDLASYGGSFDGVVVGHVLSTRMHPNAEKLTLCNVDLGGATPVQIVCGAPNVAAGQRVPVATVGAKLQLRKPEDPAERQTVTLRRATIRGEVSEGMICSEDELGLSDDHSGILVLAPDAEVGQPLSGYFAAIGLESRDSVLDVAITPNRPDAVSHIGMARDLSAVTRRPLRLPTAPMPEPGGEAAARIRVSIDAPDGCPRYAAMLVRGVRVAESPAWLKQRLTAVGLRPRNNVVDVTNFVMYECGQPLHAFDYAAIAGQLIRVRYSRTGERFTTLDGRERELPDRTLLICDAERPVAIAGVMGGENSEVTGATTDVLIESAYFDPTTTRRAARALGMQTDASYRFERGVDRDGQIWAASRAAAIISDLTGGSVVPGAVDEHPVDLERRIIVLRRGSVRRVLGIDLDASEVRSLLRAIGFIVEEGGDGELHCTVPTSRPDVEREIDVIEEVARLHGYDSIPEPRHVQVPANLVPRERTVDFVRAAVRDVLHAAGLREIYTNSLLRDARAERFLRTSASWMPEGKIVRTLNPISREMSALRPTLLPGVLEVMRHNANRGGERLRFYEFGNVFRGGTRIPAPVPGYHEEEAALIAMMGPRQAPSWGSSPSMTDFFDVKGIVETILARLDVPDVEIAPSPTDDLPATFTVMIRAGGEPVGVAGQLAPEIAADYDLEDPVYFAELGITRLTRASRSIGVRRYRPFSRFPFLDRDLAFLVSSKQGVGPILQAIEEAGAPLLSQTVVFDVYTGTGIPADKKSVAFALRFGADRTLTDDEVDESIAQITRAVHDRFGGELRR